jgi:hypothetical protein
MTSLKSMAISPSCKVQLDNEKGYYSNFEDIKGKIIIDTPVAGQILYHDGIKISLIGLIGKS